MQINAFLNLPTDPDLFTSPVVPITSLHYPILVQPGKPRDSLQAVQTRLRKAKILNEELADYFAARRELEEAYLKQLQKISKRNFLSDPSALGSAFLPVYERLVTELAEVANVHGELEKRISEECESAVRDASSKGDWARLREHDDSLGNTIKEISSLETQMAKDQKKVEGASAKKAAQAQAKLQETERALSQTMDLWEAEAPFAFEAYQKVDSSRLELLKECVAKFETAQSDAAQRLMQISERTLQECLNFDAQADMQEFILKNGVASTGARNGRPSAAPIRRGSLAGQSSLEERSNSGIGRTNGSNNDFATSTTSIHSGDRTIGESTPSRSGGGGSTLKSAFSRIGRGRSGKDSSSTGTLYGSLPSEPSRNGMSSSSAGVNRPGTAASSIRPSELDVVGEDSVASISTNASAPGSGASGLMAPLTPSNVSSNRLAAAPPLQSSSTAPQVDSEGFSIPPPDRKPWELGGNTSLTKDDDDQEEIADSSLASSSGVLTPKVSGMNISNQPISEDSEKEKAALEKMRMTLGAPQRRATTRRDRRDVRNTTYNPGMGLGEDRPMSQFGMLNTATSSPGMSLPSSPITASGFGTSKSAFVGQPGVGEHRTRSIASISSSHLGGINPFETTASGLRASLTERVNVIFQSREPAKVMVVGELSISVKDIDTSKPLHLRLDAFEQLEKAAPNPAFLSQLAGRPGEYKLDVAALAAQGGPTISAGSGGTAVILKYQLHVSESRKAQYVPVNVHAQWRCEENQTSFLLNYQVNPESKIVTAFGKEDGTGTPASVSDLSFLVSIQPSNVLNVMTKPTGVWSSENKSMYWKLNESLSLTADPSSSSKLLARFQVDAASTPQPVMVKWKIVGRTVSDLGVSVIDDSGTGPNESIKFEEVARSCVSGKYICSA
ncbi:hypothetical protein IE53DRAFT_319927 [Violaceomyces palustris]|uniref:Uncharacterized protein n=1 Tax=Violaceomyces palustris TaxID=1673888 RepID=A0ACD0NQU0_9BASI|nr:hypothetical protein IE53DRAFT_319927 [Violaceomyces palustris]